MIKLKIPRPAYNNSSFGLVFFGPLLSSRKMVGSRKVFLEFFSGGVWGLFVLCPDKIMIVLDAFVKCVREQFGKPL